MLTFEEEKILDRWGTLLSQREIAERYKITRANSGDYIRKKFDFHSGDMPMRYESSYRIMERIKKEHYERHKIPDIYSNPTHEPEPIYSNRNFNQ